MANDVDQDGATPVDGGSTESVGTNNDARVALLNQINDSNDEGRADELANVNDDDSTEPFQANKRAEEDEDDVESVAEAAAEPEQPTKYKIKVNGRELELTHDELIARAQKVESADQYLADAKRQQRVAEAPVVQQPSQEELQRRADEEDRALVRAIQMGTEEEATAALRKLRTQASVARPSIGLDDVSRTIDERLAFNEAISHFRSEFSDIVTDPYLNKLALDRDSELLRDGDARPYAERYADIGTQLRAWKDSLVPTRAKEVVSGQDKQDRKAAAPKAPVAASAKTAPPRQETEDDDTPADVIRGMAKSRGGPQWMRG